MTFSSHGTKSAADAVPDDGLPDVDELWTRKWPSPKESSIDAAFLLIQKEAPRIPGDSAASCPVSIEAVHRTILVRGLRPKAYERTLAGVLYDAPPVPDGFRFLRTAHIMDMLAWVWEYRLPEGRTVFALVRQCGVAISVFCETDHLRLSVDQICYLHFAHTLRGGDRELVRVDGKWTLS